MKQLFKSCRPRSACTRYVCTMALPGLCLFRTCTIHMLMNRYTRCDTCMFKLRFSFPPSARRNTPPQRTKTNKTGDTDTFSVHSDDENINPAAVGIHEVDGRTNHRPSSTGNLDILVHTVLAPAGEEGGGWRAKGNSTTNHKGAGVVLSAVGERPFTASIYSDGKVAMRLLRNESGGRGPPSVLFEPGFSRIQTRRIILDR